MTTLLESIRNAKHHSEYAELANLKYWQDHPQMLKSSFVLKDIDTSSDADGDISIAAYEGMVHQSETMNGIAIYQALSGEDPEKMLQEDDTYNAMDYEPEYFGLSVVIERYHDTGKVRSATISFEIEDEEGMLSDICCADMLRYDAFL